MATSRDPGSPPPWRPSPAVPVRGTSGIPPVPPGIDLRLDGNQGSRPGAAFWTELQRDADALRGYPAGAELEAAIAARHGCDPAEVVLGAGADDVLDRLARAVLAPGRSMVVPVPTFEMIERYAAMAGADAVRVPWVEGPWPRAAVLAAIDERTVLVAVVSPNNPTGLVATADDVAAVAAAAPHALVLVDAAYAEYADAGLDLSAVARRWPNAVLVRTFSKAQGLAGLRVGYAVAHREVARWMRSVGSPFTAGRLARTAARLRLEDEDGDVARHTKAVREERAALLSRLAELGQRPLPSQANFVFARSDEPALVRDLLAGQGVAVRAFAFDGMPGLAGGLRITTPGSAQEFARLDRALRQALLPEAIVLDFDGVLVDIDGRKAIATVDDLAALASIRPVALVTSCPRRLCESLLDRYGMRPFVAHAVCAEDGPGKPDPWPVREALRRLGVERAWMVGDNPSDLEAARAAGVVALAVRPHGIGAESHAERLAAAGAGRLVDGLPGLRAMLRAALAR